MSNTPPIINNFRLIYNEPKKEKSDYLFEYKDILGFKVFKTTTNSLVYIVFDEKNDLYYNFERTIDDIENVDKDLEWLIKTFILKGESI